MVNTKPVAKDNHPKILKIEQITPNKTTASLITERTATNNPNIIQWRQPVTAILTGQETTDDNTNDL